MKVIKADSLCAESVSHAQGITKYVMVKNGEIPHLTNFSTAILHTGDSVPPHVHPDMCEVFYLQAGAAEFTVRGSRFPLKVGDCLVVEPGEEHSIENPYMEDLSLVYFGLVVQ